MCPCWLARSLLSIVNAFTFSSLHCCWNSFLNNLTPISASKLKMKQTYDVPEKVVVMELEQLSLNDVQQSIEERQKKKHDIQSKKGPQKSTASSE